MSSHDYSSFTYDCTCTESDTYAYVYPDTFGYIYLCGAFWDAPNTGTDSRGGTLIHEVRICLPTPKPLALLLVRVSPRLTRSYRPPAVEPLHGQRRHGGLRLRPDLCEEPREEQPERGDRERRQPRVLRGEQPVSVLSAPRIGP